MSRSSDFDSWSASRFSHADAFESAWKAGRKARIEDFMGDVMEPKKSSLLRELLKLELRFRRKAGETPTAKEFQERFPKHRDLVASAFATKPSSLSRPYRSGSRRNRCQVAGRYDVILPLGRGVFGRVVLARDSVLRREVAIKLLDPPKGTADPTEFCSRFIKEAQNLAKLDHPGIVEIFDAGQDEEGICFLVMKHLKGEPLNRIMERGTRFSPHDATRLLAGIAEAVQHAHDCGVIHHDLKPANIILDRMGRGQVTDFGLAADRFCRPQTAGSPAYMCPELWQRNVDFENGAADVWALGVILYQLLTGCLPFKGESSELMRAICKVTPRRPRDLNAAVGVLLDAVCMHCLEKDPGNRPTAAELAAELTTGILEQAEDGTGATVDVPNLGRQPSEKYLRDLSERLCSLTDAQEGRGYADLRSDLTDAILRIASPVDYVLEQVRLLHGVSLTRSNQASGGGIFHADTAAKLAFDSLQTLEKRGMDISADQRKKAEVLFDLWVGTDSSIAAYLFRIYRIQDPGRKRRLEACLKQLQKSPKNKDLARFIKASGPECRELGVNQVHALLARKQYAAAIKLIETKGLTVEFPPLGLTRRFIAEEKWKNAMWVVMRLGGSDEGCLKEARAILDGMRFARMPSAANKFKIWLQERETPTGTFRNLARRSGDRSRAPQDS